VDRTRLGDRLLLRELIGNEAIVLEKRDVRYSNKRKLCSMQHGL